MGLIPGLGRSPGGGQQEEIDYKQQVSTCQVETVGVLRCVFLFSNWNDYSENAIVYYMSDTSTKYFVGDGTEDDFSVTATSIEKVTVNGVEKTSGTDYTFSSNTLTFTTAPAKDAIIQVIYK